MFTDDLRCVACDGELNFNIDKNFCECTDCLAKYDTALGVPYFGSYEEDDALGLIEIAANVKNRGKFNITPSSVEYWEEMLKEYHIASDKADYAKKILSPNLQILQIDMVNGVRWTHF